MCIVRISLRRGKTPEQLDAVSGAIYDAMVDTGYMVANDLFQIFEQLDPAELRFDPTFGGGPRSAGFLLLNVLGGPEKPVDLKNAFFKRVVELLQERAGVRPADVLIGLQATQETDWSFGHGIPLSAASK